MSGDADLRCRTGSLQVWGVSCGPIMQEDQLGAPDRAWNVRVYCAGRRKVMRAIEDEGITEGVEGYLVQFWPRHE
ncbi:hypothetical protein [Streptomyces roseolilacinus]|uniref:hypothetical protein n=1 Tax=Streptomyces roseolilacinus TaxID=66904 RepID=UPI0037F7A797